MKIDHYISELLFQYDCVIVPELGGFIGNYKPATIQNIQNTFNPPSKQISFNKNLDINDGLLANHIASQLNISYDKAINTINVFVVNIQEQLNAKKNVTIEDIGTFFLDNENRIQFEPKTANNYLLESYGLTPFQKFPIQRARLEDKITKEFKDRTAPLIVVTDGNKNKRKWIVAAAITIPLAFFAIWIPSKYDLGADLNYASLNLFAPNVSSVYSERTSTPEFEEVEEADIKKLIESTDNGAYFTSVSFDNNETTVVVQLKEEQPVAEAMSTYVATNTKQLDFHIIGGCFFQKSNARKMVKKLKKAGFDASIVGQRKGLWTVAYSSFSTRKQAVEALADVKDYNGKAWILNQPF
jgi:nucleoid DNA-binding protein